MRQGTPPKAKPRKTGVWDRSRPTVSSRSQSSTEDSRDEATESCCKRKLCSDRFLLWITCRSPCPVIRSLSLVRFCAHSLRVSMLSVVCSLSFVRLCALFLRRCALRGLFVEL